MTQPYLFPGSPALAKFPMRLVIVESPYRADNQTDREENEKYANECLQDCLSRGESPYASHLLLTRVLNDDDAKERAHGMNAGQSWLRVAEAVAVYTDRGISEGMKAGIRSAELHGVPIEYRSLG